MKALREEKAYQRNDERILGNGDFVTRVLASAEEEMEKRYSLNSLSLTDKDSIDFLEKLDALQYSKKSVIIVFSIASLLLRGGLL